MFEWDSAVCGKSACTVGMQDISLIIAMPVTPREPGVGKVSFRWNQPKLGNTGEVVTRHA